MLYNPCLILVRKIDCPQLQVDTVSMARSIVGLRRDSDVQNSLLRILKVQ
jgi:hypothetical protein